MGPMGNVFYCDMIIQSINIYNSRTMKQIKVRYIKIAKLSIVCHNVHIVLTQER